MKEAQEKTNFSCIGEQYDSQMAFHQTKKKKKKTQKSVEWYIQSAKRQNKKKNKTENCEQKILYPAKLSSKTKGEIKTFSDKQRNTKGKSIWLKGTGARW